MVLLTKTFFTVYYIIIMIVSHLLPSKTEAGKIRQQLSILAQLKQSYTKMFSTQPNEQAAA